MPPIVQVSIQSQLLRWSFCFLFWVGVLNSLFQIVSLKKGCYTLLSELAHCFHDDMHYALNFGYLFPAVKVAFKYFLLMLTYVLSVFH
jgi:hypothetical protein